MLEAVKQNSRALQYASQDLRNNAKKNKHIVQQHIFSSAPHEAWGVILSTQEMLTSNIFIDKDTAPYFIKQVKADLKIIQSTSIGSNVIAQIGLTQHPETIA